MSSEPPRRVVRIEIYFEIKLDGGDENAKDALIRSAKTCPVALSLSPEIEQQIHFTFV